MRRIQLRNGQELAQDHIGNGLMKWDPTLDPTLAHFLILSGSVSSHSSQYCINYLRKTQFQWHSGLLNKCKWITACRGKLQLLYQVYKAPWYFLTHLTVPTPTLPLYPGFPSLPPQTSSSPVTTLIRVASICLCVSALSAFLSFTL